MTGVFPIGEVSEYRDYSKDDQSASNRMNLPEKKALEISYEDMYRDIRIGAEVHRTVSGLCRGIDIAAEPLGIVG